MSFYSLEICKVSWLFCLWSKGYSLLVTGLDAAKVFLIMGVFTLHSFAEVCVLPAASREASLHLFCRVWVLVYPLAPQSLWGSSSLLHSRYTTFPKVILSGFVAMGFSQILSCALLVGLAISLVMVSRGISPWKAIVWAIVSSLPQPVG